VLGRVLLVPDIEPVNDLAHRTRALRTGARCTGFAGRGSCFIPNF
jgi:hypothetical protein